jgi:hypothetical protein
MENRRRWTDPDDLNPDEETSRSLDAGLIVLGADIRWV